ncbi:MAG: NADH-quinone oxidoreductase subunit M, partial [Thermoproteota archaeon]
SSVSQMGYLLAGVSTLTAAGVAGAMVHYAAHAVGKALLFATAGVLITQLHGLRSISKMGGLAPKMPITASLALIGFMHITGIPPSLGLWSEVLIVMGISSTTTGRSTLYFVALLAVLLIGIGLSTAYAFLTMKRIFFGQPSEAAEKAKEAGMGLLGPMIVMAAVGIALFIWPRLLIDPLMASLRILLR